MSFHSWLSALCITVLLGLAPVWASCSKPLVINLANWYPYMYLADDNQPGGLDYRLISATLDLAGCEYSFVQMPSARALRELMLGNIDMVAGASVTPEREHYAYFTEPYRDETMALFIRRGEHYNADNLKALLNDYRLTLGGVIGSWYGEEFASLDHASLTANRQLVLLSDEARLLPMLVQGRIDLLIGDLISLSEQAIRQGQQEYVAVHHSALSEGPIHFMLSKASTSAEDLRLINQAILALQQSPQYRMILADYQLP
ncbi:MAG: transporter substrate-binding domain-containing protein [Marinobacter sp.]|nr:transporter substrate-binding domain-containing protein [Marinobacter sp.]